MSKLLNRKLTFSLLLSVSLRLAASIAAAVGIDAPVMSADAVALGIAGYQQGDYKEAISLLNEDLHPELANNAKAMYYRANAFVIIGRPRFALDHYRKARALSNDPTLSKLCDQGIASVSIVLQERNSEQNLTKQALDQRLTTDAQWYSQWCGEFA